MTNLHQPVCAVCGGSLAKRKNGARTCGTGCRTKAYRMRLDTRAPSPAGALVLQHRQRTILDMLDTGLDVAQVAQRLASNYQAIHTQLCKAKQRNGYGTWRELLEAYRGKPVVVTQPRKLQPQERAIDEVKAARERAAAREERRLQIRQREAGKREALRNQIAAISRTNALS